MLAKVQKWGNSLGVRLPGKLAKNINLTDGSEIDITSLNNSIVIKPRANLLEELLIKITSQNLHGEIFDGDNTEGHEGW